MIVIIYFPKKKQFQLEQNNKICSTSISLDHCSECYNADIKVNMEDIQCDSTLLYSNIGKF
jgi:hypothetical protein